MRFEWDDEIYKEEGEVDYYKCALYDDDEEKLETISFWDYSTKRRVALDEKNYYRRPYAYEISWCNGSAHRESIDFDEHYEEHYGWHGVKEHTVADVKRWCENVLAKRYIFDYEEELAKLNERKKTSDWFVANGYGTPEEEIER